MSARILIVEDNEVLSQSYLEILEMMGYEVVALESTAKGAISRAAQSSPDLVIMDVSLKGDMDGIEAARRMSVPVLFISGFSDAARLSRMDDIPNSRYVTKPLDFGLLDKTVRELLFAGGS